MIETQWDSLIFFLHESGSFLQVFFAWVVVNSFARPLFLFLKHGLCWKLICAVHLRHNLILPRLL